MINTVKPEMIHNLNRVWFKVIFDITSTLLRKVMQTFSCSPAGVLTSI